MPNITIKISKTGDTEVEASGYSNGSCKITPLSAKLRQAFGTPVEDIPKPEAFADHSQEQSIEQ